MFMSDAIVDRFIGLAALAVGCSVIFFAVKLPNTDLGLIRKVIGFFIAAALILYGLYSIVAG
jgi:hypothetical protein